MLSKVCCICNEKPIRAGRVYFCRKCYETYKTDILNNVPWIRFVKAEEQQKKRTRRAEKSVTIVYLGDTFDISEDGDLVTINYEREEG